MSKGQPAAELLSCLCRCRWPVRVLVRTRACGLLGGALGGCQLDAVRPPLGLVGNGGASWRQRLASVEANLLVEGRLVCRGKALVWLVLSSAKNMERPTGDGRAVL
ncbi:hypothetical protein Peur_072191 [Populus x canadensis]|jgi:hypothetical protein